MPRKCSHLKTRRTFLAAAATGVAGGALAVLGDDPATRRRDDQQYPDEDRQQRSSVESIVGRGEKVRITRLETMLVQPRWLFLKVHTDAGVVGWGEPVVEGLIGRRSDE